jgi:hypothetical protein
MSTEAKVHRGESEAKPAEGVCRIAGVELPRPKPYLNKKQRFPVGNGIMMAASRCGWRPPGERNYGSPCLPKTSGPQAHSPPRTGQTCFA